MQERDFFRCPLCALAFLDPTQRPDPQAERAHYLTHENDPGDPRYRAWLDRLAAPLTEGLPPGAEGLDFGSGPAPVLAAMLAERGFDMAWYDPFFAPDPAVLRRVYAFVACSETVEHFHDPAAEFHRMDALLRPGGRLGVMTSMLRGDRPLAGWRYARDPTHVCFYAPATMRWIAEWRGWRVDFPGPDVARFHKPG